MRAHLHASMKGILRLFLISGEECSLMKQRGRKKLLKKNAACCLHGPSSRAVIVLIFGGGAVRRSWQPGCIESGGWGFYKVLQDVFFFCSRFLSWDTEYRQHWGDWSKDKIHPGHAAPRSCTTEFTTSFRREMNFNEAALHPRIIFKEMLLRFIWIPAWNILRTVTWPLWVQKYSIIYYSSIVYKQDTFVVSFFQSANTEFVLLIGFFFLTSSSKTFRYTH